MDPALYLAGQRPGETRPVEISDVSSEESPVEDAPQGVDGVNGADSIDEARDDSEEESEEGWDLDSLVEDAILELSDDQMRERKCFRNLKRECAKYRSQCLEVVLQRKEPSIEHYFGVLVLKSSVGKPSNVVQSRPRNCSQLFDFNSLRFLRGNPMLLIMTS